MKSVKMSLLAAFLLVCIVALHAQDFMMQGFYWNYPNGVGTLRFAQFLEHKVPEMHEAGFTYLWLPPLSRSANDQQSIGYDVQDYYDIGNNPLGATRFGSRNHVHNIVNTLKANNMKAVGDLIFNHRAGGVPERNDAVRGWIENYTAAKVNAGDNCFPSDRFWCYIILGDTNNNHSGNYYVKVRSASQHSNFYNKPYTVAMWTNKVPLAVDTALDTQEVEPNGGGSCAEPNNTFTLGRRKYCHVDAIGCGIDEFALHLDTSLYNATGDTLWISLANTNAKNLGDFSDQYIKGIWYDSLAKDLYSQIVYQTFTDFTHMPSGRGAMDKSNFKPNGAPTQLSGDWDEMLFFYDIDQNVTSTQTVLKDYTRWMFDSVGIGGLRLDAVKNYPYSFVSNVLNDLNATNHNPGMVVGEFYDYNPASLIGWTTNVANGMTQSAKDSIPVRVFDFALRGALKSACDQFGYDVRSVFQSGMVDGGGGNGSNAVTFVGNHDFRDAGQYVVNNPELVYAYILTNNKLGIPCVYYLDYYNTNFMRGRIKGCMRAHQRYIYGATSVDYLSRYSTPYTQSFISGFANTSLVYQLHNPTKNTEVIVAINFAGDTLNLYQKVNMANVAVGDTFTDIFGVAKPPLLTAITPNNELHIMIPPRSFTIYVRGNHADSLISLGDTLAPSVGIEAIAATESFAKVYPNPFNSKIVIQISGSKDEMVTTELYDIAGRKVYSDARMSMGQKLFIDPELTSEGIYFLKLNTADRTETFKMVRQQ